MQQDRSLMFVQEIERGLYGRSYAWEGKSEQVFDFGEVVVHAQPEFAVALCLRFTPIQIEERLNEIIHQTDRHGTANLCDAFTLPEARRRGVYLSLVAHRLAFAREQGCTLAVTRANTRTSAPILIKRGFKPVCSFLVLARHRSHT
jgi:GNAT superfamily N-acetyltransferase